MRWLTRLALGFRKKRRNLDAAVALQVAFHNFCRHRSTIRSTLAMTAGVAGHVWDVEELLMESRFGW